MRYFFVLLASAAGIYSILIFIRIIMSWFSGIHHETKLVKILKRITDPYLDWWRRKLKLRIGFLDISPVVGIVALSMIQNILHALANFRRVTIGNILAIILVSGWSIISFVLGILIIIFILRTIAYLTNRDMYSGFWKFIETFSQPLLFRLNQVISRNSLIRNFIQESYLKGLVLSTLLLAVIWLCGRILIPVLTEILNKLPL